MIDREKVIASLLEQAEDKDRLSDNGTNEIFVEDAQMLRWAVELLTPKLFTKEDLMQPIGYAWLEMRDKVSVYPVLVDRLVTETEPDPDGKRLVLQTIGDERILWPNTNRYGPYWRLWNMEPGDLDRYHTEWEVEECPTKPE